jgi:transposase
MIEPSCTSGSSQLCTSSRGRLIRYRVADRNANLDCRWRDGPARGFTGLSGLVQTVLEENRFSGHVFVFRGRRGDLIKMLWWDGDGLCLFAKRLERGRFVWPVEAGSVALTRAQLSMLLKGID